MTEKTKFKIINHKTIRNWQITRESIIGIYRATGEEAMNDGNNVLKRNFFVLSGAFSALLSLLNEKGILKDDEMVNMPEVQIDND